LIAAASDDRLHAFVALIFGLGLRRGEACGLKWTDVDLGEEPRIRVRQQVKREPVNGRVVAVVGDLKTTDSRRELHLPTFVGASDLTGISRA
jgi:integrase